MAAEGKEQIHAPSPPLQGFGRERLSSPSFSVCVYVCPPILLHKDDLCFIAEA